jgi:hypothetical protein
MTRNCGSIRSDANATADADTQVLTRRFSTSVLSGRSERYGMPYGSTGTLRYPSTSTSWWTSGKREIGQATHWTSRMSML